jgi:hypothetical protein
LPQQPSLAVDLSACLIGLIAGDPLGEQCKFGPQLFGSAIAR